MKITASNHKIHIHLIGIGGIGMSGLAKILLNMNYSVSGSDLKSNEIIEKLKKKGVDIKIGHDAKHINANVSIIVASTAISPVNPEILAAKEQKIPILHRGEILAEIMRLKKGIAVAGTHGKTTTTGLIASIFHEAKLSPTVIIGGQWGSRNTNAISGKSEYLICESDESDGSFLKLSPVYSVITNIDLDHMDYYKNEENLHANFLEFINHTPFYGKSFVCLEDRGLQKIELNISRPYVGYGLNKEYPIYAYDIKNQGWKTLFKVSAYGKKLGRFELNLSGQHNVLNSLAAIGIALESKITPLTIKKALKNFSGVKRRMTHLGKWKGISIIDDYAHHPTEINATLNGIKHLHQKKIVAFQPHRYSRTLQLYKEIAKALRIADIVFITEIYPAGEEAIKGVTGHLIYEEIRKTDSHKSIFFFESNEALKESLLNGQHYLSNESLGLPKTGYFLFMGAGDINKIAKELVE